MSMLRAAPPDPRLRLDREVLSLQEATRGFYRRDTALVARDLIGTWLARRHRGAWYGARIVETEAYLGLTDRAAHTWQGRRTKRVEPMYMDGGHVYVFLVYGMHHCANIVTREPGIGEAVLIRAAAGPAEVPARLLSGPGRFCAALGITRSCSGLDLLGGGRLRLMLPVEPVPEISVGPRVGVAYAGEAKDWPLRFFQKDSPAVSFPRRL